MSVVSSYCNAKSGTPIQWSGVPLCKVQWYAIGQMACRLRRRLQYKKLIRRLDSERELLYDNIFNHFCAVRSGT